MFDRTLTYQGLDARDLAKSFYYHCKMSISKTSLWWAADRISWVPETNRNSFFKIFIRLWVQIALILHKLGRYLFTRGHTLENENYSKCPPLHILGDSEKSIFRQSLVQPYN